jgi:hypothetical protein
MFLQDNIILGRYIILDRSAVHPLPYLLDRVSRYVSLPLSGHPSQSACSLVCFVCSAYLCERPELFAQITSGKSEEARVLLILKWFVMDFSFLPSQIGMRNIILIVGPAYVKGAIFN